MSTFSEVVEQLYTTELNQRMLFCNEVNYTNTNLFCQEKVRAPADANFILRQVSALPTSCSQNL